MGYTVTKIDEKTFLIVKSFPRDSAVYFIRFKQSRWVCECKGFFYRQDCHHMNMIAEFLPKRFPREEIDPLIPELKTHFSGHKWEVVGSYRRKLKTCKDIDVIIEATQEEFVALTQRLVRDIQLQIITAGQDVIRSMWSNKQLDITRVESGEWASYLLYRTGSRETNIMMRGRAKSRGMKLNEHGLFVAATNRRLTAASEADIFKKLGLQYLPPEKR